MFLRSHQKLEGNKTYEKADILNKRVLEYCEKGVKFLLQFFR